MKPKTIFVAILLIICILPGCVISIHPLFTSDDLVFDKRLLGTWSVPGENETWKFETGEHEMTPYANKNSYLLKNTENGETRKFTANLTKLGDEFFLDLYPDDEMKTKNSLFEYHFLPVHTFAKIRIYDNKFELYFFNSDLLTKALQQNTIRLKHESLQYYEVITASTEELQQFVKKYAQRKDVFEKATIFTKAK
jgi:hypothetical protein